MLVRLSALLVLFLCVHTLLGQDEGSCSDGECCSGLWFARQINLLWQGPIHYFNLTECAAVTENCRREVGTSCDSISAASDCKIQGQCCWLAFWQNTQLTDEYQPGLSWGQYLCNEINAMNGPIDRDWTMDLKGQWYHCAKGNRFWETYDAFPPATNLTLPTLCCNSGAIFQEC